MQDDTSQSSKQYQNPVDGKTYTANGGWQDYSPQNPQPAGPNARVKLGDVRLLTDQTTIAANISSEDLSNYIKAVVSALEPVAEETQTPFQVMLQFELKPAEKVSIQIASQGEVGNEILQKIYDTSLNVAAPQPSAQPIIFQATISINPGHS